MKKIKEVEFENEGLSCKVIDDIAVLRLSCNIFDYLLNIEYDTEMLEWFDLVEKSRTRGILTISENNCYGEKNYVRFLSDAAGKELDPEHPEEVKKFAKSDIRAIEINMLMNFIRKIISFKKIFVTALQGEVVTPFFGMALAADFRFVDKNSTFLLTHSKYSLHPSGGLPFFLPRYLGQAKAIEYLIKGGRITAEEALQMNLVNNVFTHEEFFEKCLYETKELTRLGLSYVKTTKSLIYSYSKDLDKYFDIESNFLYS